MTERSHRKSMLERVLSVVAEVRGGEGFTALLLTINVFLLLTAYYIIKPVREELILDLEGGAELKAYAGAASALLLLVAVPLYGKLVDRLARNRLIIGVTAFFTACLIGFYFLSEVESVRPALGVPFFLWVGMFSMMVVAQFWGFANDLYTEEQGQRLFVILALGQSLGAVVGSKLTSLLVAPPAWWPLPELGVYTLLLISGGLLAFTALLTEWAHGRGGAVSGGADAQAHPASDAPRDKKRDAFALVFSTRYLLLLACFSLAFTFVNTNGEYMLGKLVKAQSEAEQDGWITAFYGDFYFYVNSLGLLLQTFAVSRIVKYGGLRVAFFVFPVVVLFSSLAVVVAPVLAVLRITKTMENATDYSLNNTVRNMLWLPTTTQMKYKAKQVVDTFMVRMGDVSSGALVFVGTAGMEYVGFHALTVRGFAICNILLVLAWLVLARAIVRENRRLSAQQAGRRSAPQSQGLPA